VTTLIKACTRFTTNGNLLIRYIDNNQRGSPVLLIHGLGGSVESWTNNIESFSARYRVIALDLPGFGLSDKPRIDYTIDFYVNFLKKFIKKLKITRPSLIGSSLGGHIVVELSIRNPKLVDKVVLISPAGSLPKSFKGTSALKRYVKIVRAKSALEVREILSSIDNSMVTHTYAEALYKRISLPGAKYAFISALKGSAKAARYNSKLEKINTKILLIWGKNDRIIPVKFIRTFLEHGDSRIIIFENCGHRPHVEKPQLFNKAVKDFLMD
jgi:2-hydroxy-6-oxonona-2,4-dienedioate hydrolase